MSWRESSLRSDLAYSLRRLRAAPAFFAAAIMVLAIGVGATTTLFSHANNVLLKPIPLPLEDRLAAIARTNDRYPPASSQIRARYLDRLEMLRPPSVEDMAFVAPLRSVFGRGDTAEVFSGELVSGAYFRLLGVHPRLGRLLDTADDQPGASGAVVLSEELWRRLFAGSPDALGQAIDVGGRPLTIVGVAPSSFRGLVFANVLAHDIWVPRRIGETLGNASEARRANKEFGVIVRLRGGVSFGQAGAEVHAIGRQLNPAEPEEGLALVPLQRYFAPPLVFSGAGVVLLAVSILIVAIAAANLTMLCLARTVDRSGEIAIRMALGATDARIHRLLVTETTALTICGGAAGLFVAWMVTAGLGAAELPRIKGRVFRYEADLDVQVLVYALVATAMTAIAISLAPAIRATATEPLSLLSSSGIGTGGTRQDAPARRRLLAFQIGCSMVLLVIAGLFVRSSAAARGDEVLRRSDVVVGHFDLYLHQYDELSGQAAYDAVMRAVSESGAGAQLALGSALPLAGEGSAETYASIERRPAMFGTVDARAVAVSPDYFNVLSIPVILGRTFLASDDKRSPRVAVITASVASRLWPGEPPIGRNLYPITRGEAGAALTVVGIVPDPSEGHVGTRNGFVFVPIKQRYEGRSLLLARGLGGAAAARELRIAVARAGIAAPMFDVRTLDDELDVTRAPQRLAAWTLSSIAALGVLLALTGIYAAVAYVVNIRRREFGVMRALGATPRDIYVAVIKEQVRTIALGVGGGLAAAAICAGLVRPFLHGFTPYDWFTYSAVPILLVSLVLASSILAVRRVAGLDPAVALRST